MDPTTPPVVTDGVTIDFGVIELTGSFRHDDEQRLLELTTDEGIERISVNLSAYGLVPESGNVFVKDWSEHAGLTAGLVEAGLVSIVRAVVVGPFASTAFEVVVNV